MIKAGILGADSSIGGELLRLLLLHPEIELKTICSPHLKGIPVVNHHRGLIGDTELRFSDSWEPDDLDVVFVCSSLFFKDFPNTISDNLKVIYIQDNEDPAIIKNIQNIEFVPGISEMFRKPLVRGARASRILSSPVSASVIVLYPLALHLLLNDSVKVSIRNPRHKNESLSSRMVARELFEILSKVQLSFKGFQNVSLQDSEALRVLSVDVEINLSISKEEIEKIYNDIYGDHNFTFIVDDSPLPTEVAGTHKCLISVSKPSDDKIKITAVADSILRGGAGDAIHVMNLLFGLFEKTGLSLPATYAFNDELFLQNLQPL